jgi:hypothetical protein
MQAIKTKYLPATNFKGSRIKASCEAGSITIPYPYELSGDKVHIFAATELCNKLGWNILELHTGVLSDCYVHIPVLKKHEDTNLPEFLKDQV